MNEQKPVAILLMDRPLTADELAALEKRFVSITEEPWRELIDESDQLGGLVDNQAADNLIARWWTNHKYAPLHVFGLRPPIVSANLSEWMGDIGGNWDIDWYEPHYVLVGDPPTPQFQRWLCTAMYSIPMPDAQSVVSSPLAVTTSMPYQDVARKIDWIITELSEIKRQIQGLATEQEQATQAQRDQITDHHDKLKPLE